MGNCLSCGKVLPDVPHKVIDSPMDGALLHPLPTVKGAMAATSGAAATTTTTTAEASSTSEAVTTKGTVSVAAATAEQLVRERASGGTAGGKRSGAAAAAAMSVEPAADATTSGSNAPPTVAVAVAVRPVLPKAWQSFKSTGRGPGDHNLTEAPDTEEHDSGGAQSARHRGTRSHVVFAPEGEDGINGQHGGDVGAAGDGAAATGAELVTPGGKGAGGADWVPGRSLTQRAGAKGSTSRATIATTPAGGQPEHDPFGAPLHTKLSKSLRILSQVAGKNAWNGTWIIRQTANVRSQYTFGGRIARGEFGLVYTVKHNATAKKYACKCLAKKKLLTDADVVAVQREVQVLHLVGGHPAVITLHDMFEDKKQVCLVMDRCLVDLHDYLRAFKRLSEHEAAALFDQMVAALVHCHAMGVIHRDIKPENFLVADSKHPVRIKLIDFGLSTFYREGQRFNELLGSPFYVAPEVIKRSYSREADVWSTGVVLYQMIAGRPPFYGDDDHAVFKLIQTTEPDLSSGVWEDVSEGAKDLIASMLLKNPSRRATLQEVINHPWLVEWRQQGAPPPRAPPTKPSKRLITAESSAYWNIDSPMSTRSPTQVGTSSQHRAASTVREGASPSKVASGTASQGAWTTHEDGDGADRGAGAMAAPFALPGGRSCGVMAAGGSSQQQAPGATAQVPADVDPAAAASAAAAVQATAVKAVVGLGVRDTRPAGEGAEEEADHVQTNGQMQRKSSSEHGHTGEPGSGTPGRVRGVASLPQLLPLASAGRPSQPPVLADRASGASVALDEGPPEAAQQQQAVPLQAPHTPDAAGHGPNGEEAPDPFTTVQQQHHHAHHHDLHELHELHHEETWDMAAMTTSLLYTRLKAYAASGPLRRMILRCMAGALPSECYVGLHNVFHSLDADRSGRLDVSKVQLGLSRRGVQLGTSEVAQLLAGADLDGDGVLSEAEWTAATMWLPCSKVESLLQEAFLIFDKDDDAKVDVSEVVRAMGGAEFKALLPGGKALAAGQLPAGATLEGSLESLAAALVKASDTDGDGELSYEEFCAVVGGGA